MNPMAKSLLGMRGAEYVDLHRFAGSDLVGGYAEDSYDPAVEVRVLLRPGDIDVPIINTMGEEGTHDWWCISALETDIGENDIIERRADAVSEEESSGHRYRVSMARRDPEHGLVLAQLDENDSGP